jgi:ATP-GRASP peptide maturase of grasp-with-spasm system
MSAKNVLIFGVDGDWTVRYVMDWLYYYGANVSKITSGRTNVLTPYIFLDNEKTETSLFLDGVKIDNENIYKIWLHRSSPTKFQNIEKETLNKVNKFISNFQIQEQSVYLNYCFSQFSNNKYTVPPNLLSLNKLEILKLAKKHGLIIPPTCVSKSKTDILRFKKLYGDIIIKPLSECQSIIYKNQSYAIYTTKLSSDLLSKQNAYFFPCLIQKYIEKQYEIRVFYLDGKCYSMAIFSQQRSDTSVDWRRKSFFYANRNVPFKLPENIENKIKKLMNGLSLKTGSIDMIYSKENEYVFLEINPVGQFGMVSYLCNYSLYKKFAEFILT